MVRDARRRPVAADGERTASRADGQAPRLPGRYGSEPNTVEPRTGAEPTAIDPGTGTGMNARALRAGAELTAVDPRPRR
ncbi:hypothetical protein GCM10010236_67100 [Streptomyces eurythermus]|nr:hypothetical protein GCM10010236_67100 [Streptomyces eurythermus]